MWKESPMRFPLLCPIAGLTLLTPGMAPTREATHAAAVSGALTATLAGSAGFGPVRQTRTALGASFSLELGTRSERGAVVFGRVNGERPGVGTYRVTPLGPGAEGPNDFHAVVALGSVELPVGVFHGVSGSVTITQSSENRIVGRYELTAVGFLASDPEVENREITVRGGFSAERAEAASLFEATISGAAATVARGAAEFGEVGLDRERSFSLTMGAYAEQGAIVLARNGGGRPGVGIYRVTPSVTRAGEFHGLVVTGSPSHPAGVFRVERGTMSVTASSAERISGTFEFQATGFLAADPAREDRRVTVSGSFTATPGGQVTALTLN
jgi:hypothetical protein